MRGETWGQFGSAIASFMFLWAMVHQYFPHYLRASIETRFHKLAKYFNPYVKITFHEFSGDRMKRSEAYKSIENYLGSRSTKQAKRLKGDVNQENHSLVLTMDDHEEVTDEYEGINFKWASIKTVRESKSISFSPPQDDKRSYRLTFHAKHRKTATETYLDRVLREGREIGMRKRQRKLYTNSPSDCYGFKRTMWSHIVFEHRATFDTLAMDPKKKKEIMDDLVTFSKARDYYARIGKAWKRGYLLYGPPGTGKSTMIAAIANFLNYDVYDVELTAVKNNTDLRKLLIETSSKSVIVLEDIDCSLELTGQRENRDEEKKEEGQEIKKDGAQEKEEKKKKGGVTLSGLLNFIDGLWSASGGERLIVFTTNHVEKLDPALIRRGRMDRHIEMSYCDFESFRVLARNYLGLESHPLFGAIRGLLEEIDMTPADVAENLMPKTVEEDAGVCLGILIEALENAKEEARKKLGEKEEKVEAEQGQEEEKAMLTKKKKKKEKAMEKGGKEVNLKAEREPKEEEA